MKQTLPNDQTQIKSPQGKKNKDSIQIMVVDDEQSVRQFLYDLLKGEGYNVICASGGGEALRILNDETIDLLILDIVMPAINGLRLLEMLPDPSIPVIMLSGLKDEASIASSFERGAVDYISKPFSNKELLARIKAKLRRA